jgi:RNA polymerase sigma-70 factor (ECF subfamily)
MEQVLMNQNARGIATADPRDGAQRYLPLDRLSAERFLNDHEPLASAVLARLRVRETDATLSRIFQRALRGLPAFRGESRLSSWVYRIAWREGLRQAARERAQDARDAPLEIAVNRPDGAEDQLRTLERQQTAEAVRAALGRLGPRDREILALRYLEELPFAVIAERLDVAESAAKVRSHRALTRLRLLLEEDHD